MAPFAVACLYDRPNDTNIISPDTSNNWHASVKGALLAATNSEFDLVVDNDSHIAIVLKNSSLSNTNQVTRIARNHLMREYPSNLLSIAVAQIDAQNTDIDDLLSDVCNNLNRNIEQKSSRIEVRHYKA